MKTQPTRYLAYMLRLIPIQRDGAWTWRASLENAHTGERLGFASLEMLVAFLQERIGEKALENNVPGKNGDAKVSGQKEEHIEQDKLIL